MTNILSVEELKLRRGMVEGALKTHLDTFDGGDMQVDLARLHSEYWVDAYELAFRKLIEVRRLSFRGRCPDARRSL
jgi:hypothetical protein